MARTMRFLAMLAALALLLVACNGADEVADEPADPADYAGIEDQPAAAASFVSPSDGDTVSSPFTAELAAEGITLTPAGAPAAGEAHLHVIAGDCFETGETIPGPTDEDEAEGRFHLGDGSDSREIDLEPGTHDLCVQLGDGVHVAFGDTAVITLTVE